MGCCCSCLESRPGSLDGGPNGRGGGGAGETELAAGGSAHRNLLAISRALSSTTVEVQEPDRTGASGYGLALAGVSIEQDAAYWEAHVDVVASASSEPSSSEIMLGVATKKDRQFFKDLEEAKETDEPPLGTEYMRKIRVKSGDVIGIAVQQSDLPMVQFLKNGEPLHDLAINRFRGASVHPSLYLFGEHRGSEEGLVVRLVFRESDFAHLPPHARFGPVIVARGIL